MADLPYDETEPEEATWSNIQGYYGMLSRLMHSVTYYEMQDDLAKYWRGLRSMYGWTATYLREKESNTIRDNLKTIKTCLLLCQHWQNSNVPKKAGEEMQKADDLLYTTKIALVDEMKRANLLIGVREKGSDWLA